MDHRHPRVAMHLQWTLPPGYNNMKNKEVVTSCVYSG